MYAVFNRLLPFFQLPLALIAITLFTSVYAQEIPDTYAEIDYQVRPERGFKIQHMDLKLTLEPDKHLIRGVVTYTVQPLRAQLDTMVMRIADSAVDGVSMDGMDVSYEIRSDSLIIDLPDEWSSDSSSKLNIIWQSTSTYALIRDHLGFFRSSLDPGSHYRWLPGFGHPRDAFTFDATFIIPATDELVFNGKRIKTEMVDEERVAITYRSTKAINYTDLVFVCGAFGVSTVNSGLSKLRIYFPSEDSDSLKYQQVLKSASDLKSRLENTLGRELPWPQLSLVLLPDSYWQQRHHASGIIQIFTNGDLYQGLQKGMISQWIGSFHRSEQFYGTLDVITLLQQQALVAAGDSLMRTSNPDSLLAFEKWNRWSMASPQVSENLLSSIRSQFDELIRLPADNSAIDDYIELIYQKTGISIDRLNPPTYLSFTDLVHKKEENSSIYQLDVEHDEMNSTLQLVFSLKQGDGDELNSIDLTLFGMTDTLKKELLITGESDTIRVNAPRGLEYIMFDDYDYLQIGTYPDYFLAAALRSDDPQVRLFASKTLTTHTENPDLQLALNDALSREKNEEVKSALLEALRVFTGAAAGTEDKFLDNLNSDDPKLQRAALQGLSNYEGDERVVYSVQSLLFRTKEKSVFEDGLNTLLSIADSTTIYNTMKRLIQDKERPAMSLIGIRFADTFTPEEKIEASQNYLGEEYSFAVRSEALEILFSQVRSAENRKKWITQLYGDNDPRIRYLVLEQSMDLNRLQALEILSIARHSEDHPGVQKRIGELFRTLSK